MAVAQETYLRTQRTRCRGSLAHGLFLAKSGGGDHNHRTTEESVPRWTLIQGRLSERGRL